MWGHTLSHAWSDIAAKLEEAMSEGAVGLETAGRQAEESPIPKSRGGKIGLVVGMKEAATGETT